MLMWYKEERDAEWNKWLGEKTSDGPVKVYQDSDITCKQIALWHTYISVAEASGSGAGKIHMAITQTKETSGRT